MLFLSMLPGTCDQGDFLHFADGKTERAGMVGDTAGEATAYDTGISYVHRFES